MFLHIDFAMQCPLLQLSGGTTLPCWSTREALGQGKQKSTTSFKIVISFVCLFPVRLAL